MDTRKPAKAWNMTPEPSATLLSEPAFEFTEWPFYWLARAERSYLVNMERALAPHQLDVPRWRVLMSLHKLGRASVSELADHAIVKLPTMTKIVQRMQADGLVCCEQSVRDGRVTEVVITQLGEEAGARAWHIAQTIQQRAFAQISPRDRERLTIVLRQISENLR